MSSSFGITGHKRVASELSLPTNDDSERQPKKLKVGARTVSLLLDMLSELSVNIILEGNWRTVNALCCTCENLRDTLPVQLLRDVRSKNSFASYTIDRLFFQFCKQIRNNEQNDEALLRLMANPDFQNLQYLPEKKPLWEQMKEKKSDRFSVPSSERNKFL